ncbi:AcfA family outer membrane beta-barrel protein [Vibrio renipiscarius]|uniref:AcfA family outer membrane beta-barrel protein n=1 Tax=Vibrio renipiscarius TaxID=1461322 RepID=UPI0035542268
MKKYCLLPLLACAFPAVSSPYVGLEVGLATPQHNIKINDQVDGLTLSPDSTDRFAGLWVGYAFNNNLALELGYQKNHHYSDNDTAHGWDVELTSKQFSLAPVYSWSLFNNRDWTIKLKAGATYTQYQLSANKTRNDPPFYASKSTNELGAIGTMGLEYHLTPNVTLGCNLKYQADSYSSMSMMTFAGSYYF